MGQNIGIKIMEIDVQNIVNIRLFLTLNEKEYLAMALNYALDCCVDMEEKEREFLQDLKDAL